MSFKSQTIAHLSNPGSTTPIARSKVPSTLLDLSHPPESTLAISIRNKNESLLVALPSEILKQILTEVVGGQTIHVLPKGSRSYKTRMCTLPEDCTSSDSPRIHLARDDNTFTDEMEDDSCFTLRHEECSSGPTAVNAKRGLSLDVLRVCREFHHVGALLPFQDNKFVFGLHAPIEGPPPTMDGFVNRLIREQREAVRHIPIASSDLDVARVKSQLARLSSLRPLHILLAPGNDPMDMYMALQGSRSFADTYTLNWLPLRIFRITMEVYTDRRALYALSSQARVLDRFLRYLEAETLRQNSKLVEIKSALPEAEDFGFEAGVGGVLELMIKLSRELCDSL